jgi:hypothetical protein
VAKRGESMPISRAKARPEQVESAQSTCELGGLFPVMQVQQPDALHGVKDGKDLEKVEDTRQNHEVVRAPHFKEMWPAIEIRPTEFKVAGRPALFQSVRMGGVEHSV